MSKRVSMTYHEAVEKVAGELKKEGFGVITSIDVKYNMKQKIGAVVNPYIILEACTPQIAHRALTAEPELGLLLPCNVVVYTDPDGHTNVSFFDPIVMSAIISNPALKPVGEEVKEKYDRVFKAIG